MKPAFLITCLALALGGCATTQPRTDVPRLLSHPQAAAAAQAAPDFFTEAMNTIARLDHELNAAGK